jgi:NAD(P)-dependent dehydrogenase (short-subunit alcohol dehydrogenase family)
MDLGLGGAAAVVVGGTRGMGLAAAQCLAAEGCRVAVVGRDAARLAEAAKTLSDASCPCTLELRADVGSGAEVDAAFESVRAAWGELNILINAVGPSGAGAFEELSDADWTAALDRGALSAVRCTRAALPLLRAARWARIVNVTAMSVQHQLPYLVSYTAAKSALLSVTKNLARSLAPDGILVNAVAPGAILTDWAKPTLRAAGVSDTDPVAAFDVLSGHGAGADLRRLGLPGEVAAVIAFCASQRNSFMTGAHINVDGGSDFR